MYCAIEIVFDNIIQVIQVSLIALWSWQQWSVHQSFVNIAEWSLPHCWKTIYTIKRFRRRNCYDTFLHILESSS